VIREERRGSSLVVTVDRPQAKNALDGACLDTLTRLFRQLPTEVRAVVVTGGSGTFVSGGDLKELRHVADRETTLSLADRGRAMCDAIEEAKVPVLAAIEGYALGGGAELAVACDLRVMAKDAIFGFRQTRMGVSPAWGTFSRLVAQVGSARAAEVFYTAENHDAESALARGLVEHVAPPGRALDHALGLATEIAKGAPEAIAAVKGLALLSRRSEALRALEREHFVTTWLSRDHAEAVSAWFEKRPPRWGAAPPQTTE
jgi:enoyl-CoA hydratase